MVSTPDLNTALAKAQAEFQPIICNKTAKVTFRDGGSGYNFKYADLQTVISATQPALSKHGLAVSDQIEMEDGEKPKITVYLRHVSGQAITSSLPIPQQFTKAQELGSLISFYRRYLLSGLLHVSSQEDDDANHVDGNLAHISDIGRNYSNPARSPQAASGPATTQRDDRAKNNQMAGQPKPQNHAPGMKSVVDRSDLEIKNFPIPGKKYSGQTIGSMDQFILGEFLHWVKSSGPKTFAYNEFVSYADEWFRRTGPLEFPPNQEAHEAPWPTSEEMVGATT